jgi:hypothetical protein
VAVAAYQVQEQAGSSNPLLPLIPTQQAQLRLDSLTQWGKVSSRYERM